MYRVYISNGLPEDLVAPLRSVADVEMWNEKGPVPRATLLEEVELCDGLLSMLVDSVDQDLLSAAPRLRVVSQMAVGVDNIDLDACRARGLVVGHTPDVLTETTADTAFALMSASLRRIPEGAAAVKEGRWGPWDPWWMLGDDIHGLTLGIVGMGRIGQAVLRRSMGFGMDVLYSTRTPKDVGGASPARLEDLLGRSDVVMLTAPLTEETWHLIDGAALDLMKETAHLVNVSRGPLVDTDALVVALRQRRIAGAALDVTDPEPLPSGHPLLSLPNCLVVPHIGSASVRTRRAMADLAVRNLIAGLSGKPMPAEFPLMG